MKHCDKCNVQVRGNEARCPLCQHRLSGEGEGRVYPQIVTVYRQYEFFFKMMAIITIAIGLVCCAINLVLRDTGFWSLFVVLGLVCYWIILYLAIRKRKNIPKNIVYQVMVVSIASIVWDLLTGWRGWSVDFVLPIACVVAMFIMMVVVRVMHIETSDYISCLLADMAFGIIPLVLYLLDITTVFIPSIICCTLSILSLAAIIIFQGRTILIELSKRFHV